MLEKLIKVQERLNGVEAEQFKTEAYGEYLTGDITLVFGEQSYTLSFYEGTVVHVAKGTPLTGIDIGVGGPEVGWQELYTHKNFSKAINPMHGKLQLMGNMIRCMSNLNCLGFLGRAICKEIK
jgi:hypothetical protein